MSASEPQLGPWVALAAFAQPHGVLGRIKVKSLADGLDDFAHAGPLTDDRGNSIKLKLTGHAQGMAVVEVEGVTTREQAELLRGRKIGAPRAALPPLKNPKQFYVHDLIGMAVIDGNGQPYGTVEHVENYGASDILAIATPGGIELYAFTDRTFPEIDMHARTIRIHPPEILSADDGKTAARTKRH